MHGLSINSSSDTCSIKNTNDSLYEINYNNDENGFSQYLIQNSVVGSHFPVGNENYACVFDYYSLVTVTKPKANMTTSLTPMPLLKMKQEKETTGYCIPQPIEDINKFAFFCRKIEMFNYKRIEESTMKKFVDSINDDSSEKQKEFKKQYEVIKLFNDRKDELFDEPIRFATGAFYYMKDIDSGSEIIDLNADGDRVEYQKQNDDYLVDLYDDDNKLSMAGKFRMLRDHKGNILKEDEEGNILTPDDKKYQNPESKFCFDIELMTYNKDIEKPLFGFKRKMSLKDGKYRHNMDIQCYNRLGELEYTTDTVSIPKYSIDWLKHRIPKVEHDVYKSDLRRYKQYALEQTLNPNDILNTLECDKEQAASAQSGCSII